MPEPFVDVRPPLPKTPPLAHSPKQDSKTNFAKQLDRMLWDMLRYGHAFACTDSTSHREWEVTP
jgi:hypothetical protein